MFGGSFVNLRVLGGLCRCWLSINRAVMQVNYAARAMLGRIHNARIKWARIDVQTHSTLRKLPWIQHAVHRVGRIDRTRMSGVHFDGICRRELTTAMVEVLGE